MKSSRRIKFDPNFTSPPSQTLILTTPDSRRRRELKGILKKNDGKTETVAVTPPVTAASKKLVLGQVKILKRGEVLNNSSRILKEVNSNKESSKQEKEKKMFMCAKPDVDFTLSSTHRMGPDIEIVSKQMKNITECFAGSVLFDSPPPSSVPLPGFLKRNMVNS